MINRIFQAQNRRSYDIINPPSDLQLWYNADAGSVEVNGIGEIEKFYDLSGNGIWFSHCSGSYLHGSGGRI